jgi:type II secretory pathway pseudopilin PulG
MAVSSLVLGLFGWLVITAIAGLVCGIVAMTKIKRSQGRLRGQGLALAGTIISGCMLILVVPVAMMAALLLPALGAAKGKAQTIMCVNNMKQIGLALRIYSGDNNDKLPADLLVMTNELGSPMILFCPADPIHTRPMSSSWWGLTTNNISYEYLTPGAYESNVVNSIVLRCPIHGNVCLGDGSVQQRNARTARTPTPSTAPGTR